MYGGDVRCSRRAELIPNLNGAVGQVIRISTLKRTAIVGRVRSRRVPRSSSGVVVKIFSTTQSVASEYAYVPSSYCCSSRFVVRIVPAGGRFEFDGDDAEEPRVSRRFHAYASDFDLRRYNAIEVFDASSAK